jgi:CheY-like chemotaxis protein
MIQLYLESLCEEMGVTVLGLAASATEAEQIVSDKKPEYVLMDVRLFGARDGIDAAIQIKQELPDTKIIFITGSNEPPTLLRIEDQNPHRVLIKPIDPIQLQAALGA